MYRLTDSGAVVHLASGTFIPDDPANADYRIYLEWRAQGNEPEPVPPPTLDQIKSKFVEPTQLRLDAFARTRGYDGILSACTYVGDLNPRFDAEGRRAVYLRGATWTKHYEILDEVEAGTRPMPSCFADIEDELPKLEWIS